LKPNATLKKKFSSRNLILKEEKFFQVYQSMEAKFQLLFSPASMVKALLLSSSI
jgi:hypothetical protein